MQVLTSAPQADCAPSERLNKDCHCVTLRRDDLRDALIRESNDPAFWAALVDSRPYLFADAKVFLSQAQLATMTNVVAAAEAAATLPLYRATALARAAPLAQRSFGPLGAFMGYDFHLAPAGPQLIEINTNAGGAFLNAFLMRAQSACCGDTASPAAREDFDAAVVAMFQAEWRLQGKTGRLNRIAIVDDQPAQQFLYPEFQLAQRVLQQAGIDTVIAAAADLEWRDGTLYAAGAAIDLVYNRLVDFALDEPHHAALRDAYASGSVVVTPNPHLHAIHADKRNLVLLSDAEFLRAAGLDAAHTASLAAVPKTVPVTAENADELWDQRKRWFFKPSAGYGSKAVYRGEKITRGVWADILAGQYVGQAFTSPSERTIAIDGVLHARKVDVRLYTYAGRLLVAAARIYQGQVTNFRTPGGGFAAVAVV